MGTALTPAELAEWTTALNNVETARRTGLLTLLAAAPAVGHGLRYSEFTAAYATGGMGDAELALQDVAGLRAHDRRYIVRQYEQSTAAPGDSANAPILTARGCKPRLQPP